MKNKGTRWMLIGALLLLIPAGLEASQYGPTAGLPEKTSSARPPAHGRWTEGLGARGAQTFLGAQEVRDYSHREAAAKDLEDFKGGHEVEVVYVGGAVVLVVVLVVLILLL